jgi:hypothetical protein
MREMSKDVKVPDVEWDHKPQALVTQSTLRLLCYDLFGWDTEKRDRPGFVT